ncbi:hypothetical protein Hanom_Chr11g00999531 [Helianthus anomalus]
MCRHTHRKNTTSMIILIASALALSCDMFVFGLMKLQHELISCFVCSLVFRGF